MGVAEVSGTVVAEVVEVLGNLGLQSWLLQASQKVYLGLVVPEAVMVEVVEVLWFLALGFGVEWGHRVGVWG